MADILEQLNKSYNPWQADDESSMSQGEAESWRLSRSIRWNSGNPMLLACGFNEILMVQEEEHITESIEEEEE